MWKGITSLDVIIISLQKDRVRVMVGVYKGSLGHMLIKTGSVGS
mgnify:CR=1 FL=1